MNFPTLVFLSSLTTFALTASVEVRVPSSCTNLPDGLHYIQPTTDGAIIPAVCNEGYAIIDLSLNKDKISSYFLSTMEYWSIDDKYNIVGVDDKIDSNSISWTEWWTPASEDNNVKFRVSTDCMNCQSSMSYFDNTAYYMTNNFFCSNEKESNIQKYNKCNDYDIKNGANKVANDLIFDIDNIASSMCNVCDDSYRTDANGAWTDCYALKLPSNTAMDINDNNCLNSNKFVVKPSITDGGEFCTCYKPSVDDSYFSYYYEDEIDLYQSILPKVDKNRYKAIKETGLYINPLVAFEEDKEEEEEEEEEIESDIDIDQTKNGNNNSKNKWQLPLAISGLVIAVIALILAIAIGGMKRNERSPIVVDRVYIKNETTSLLEQNIVVEEEDIDVEDGPYIIV